MPDPTIPTATLVHKRYQVTSEGRIPKLKVYKFTDATQNRYTPPIDTHGAKSVWVAVESNTAAEYYIPSLLAEDEVTNDATIGSDQTGSASGLVTNEFDTTDDTGYMLMQSSFVSDGTDERAGIGYNVVVPSSTGAGFIAGDCMPPMLSIKVTGADNKDVYVFVSY